jgi:hypothetical protein
MKLAELINCEKEFGKVLAMNLKAKVSSDLLKLAKLLNEEIKTYNEVKNKKIIELGEEVEVDGKKTTRVKPENEAQFFAEIGELLDQEVNIVVNKVAVDQLGDNPISPVELQKLNWLIEQ